MTKILLVEDDKSLREIYGIRLAAEGYDIVSAGDGEEALAMAAQVKPDLIISDVMMPKISGFDMVDILRQTPGTKDIKVIMMTALSSDDQRIKGESVGADRYLVKSQVGIEDVVNVVHEVLGDRAPGQGAPAGGMVMAAIAQNAATGNEPTGLPQPVAPFTPPRPANLGEKVLNPISDMSRSLSDEQNDIQQRVAQELGEQPVNVATPAPAAASTPTPPPPAPMGEIVPGIVPSVPVSPVPDAIPPAPPAPAMPAVSTAAPAPISPAPVPAAVPPPNAIPVPPVPSPIPPAPPTVPAPAMPAVPTAAPAPISPAPVPGAVPAPVVEQVVAPSTPPPPQQPDSHLPDFFSNQ
ncbi:response regulator [Candidatus Saccharibacteria bacterium]|nr:response regulator [Candidatus Saccharibacteria bacterium]